MEVRDAYAVDGGAGVETICFNTYGHNLGKINWNNFERKWQEISNVSLSSFYLWKLYRIHLSWAKKSLFTEVEELKL